MYPMRPQLCRITSFRSRSASSATAVGTSLPVASTGMSSYLSKLIPASTCPWSKSSAQDHPRTVSKGARETHGCATDKDREGESVHPGARMSECGVSLLKLAPDRPSAHTGREQTLHKRKQRTLLDPRVRREHPGPIGRSTAAAAAPAGAAVREANVFPATPSAAASRVGHRPDSTSGGTIGWTASCSHTHSTSASAPLVLPPPPPRPRLLPALTRGATMRTGASASQCPVMGMRGDRERHGLCWRDACRRVGTRDGPVTRHPPSSPFPPPEYSRVHLPTQPDVSTRHSDLPRFAQPLAGAASRVHTHRVTARDRRPPLP